jgi:ankyrin repeat protein
MASSNRRGLGGIMKTMTAAAVGQLEVVHLLLDRGADPSVRDVDGDTAPSFARENGHVEVVELLEQTVKND